MESYVKTEWTRTRMGYYFIAEATGGTPLPNGPLAPKCTARYWREMYESLGGRVRRRRNSFPSADAPASEHASADVFRYSQKIEIKTLESVMDLFHRLLAPGEKVCAIPCSHSADGLPPGVAKRYLDSLQVALARLDLRISERTGQMLEDALDEKGVIRNARDRLVELLSQGSESPGEPPDAA